MNEKCYCWCCAGFQTLVETLCARRTFCRSEFEFGCFSNWFSPGCVVADISLNGKKEKMAHTHTHTFFVQLIHISCEFPSVVTISTNRAQLRFLLHNSYIHTFIHLYISLPFHFLSCRAFIYTRAPFCMKKAIFG